MTGLIAAGARVVAVNPATTPLPLQVDSATTSPPSNFQKKKLRLDGMAKGSAWLFSIHME